MEFAIALPQSPPNTASMTCVLRSLRRSLPFALAIGALSALPGLAQTIGEPLPGRGAAGGKQAPAQAERGSRPCPEYGPGFVRVDGSTTCVRLGGSVRAEFGKSSRSNYASGAEARLAAESRTETSAGTLRTVISGRVRRDTGLDNGPFR